MIIEKERCCPCCDDVMCEDDFERFGMCIDCFADDIIKRIDEDILSEFIGEYCADFKQYISDNYF